MADERLQADHVGELDRALLAAGRMRWTALVRDPTGACVGGTEVTFEQERPSIVQQQNTGIDLAHRGFGLAKWAKAAMFERSDTSAQRRREAYGQRLLQRSHARDQRHP